MDAENGELKRTSVCRWITFRFITVCSQFLIDSPRIVRGTGSIKRSNVRRLSVRPFVYLSSHRSTAGNLAE